MLFSYPLSLATNWLSPQSIELDDTLKSWLCESGSLTKRLKSVSDSFSVEVLNETVVPASDIDQTILQCAGKVHVREVLLCCNNQPMVYAQSWIPLTEKQHMDLCHLGSKPLGEVIFDDPQLQRCDLHLAQFDQIEQMQHLMKSLSLNPAPTWGRRSCFELTGQTIMVCEVFLPGAFAYQ